MTVTQAIVEADRLYPNSFTDEEKIGWLQRMDEGIIASLYSLYEDSVHQTVPDYMENTEASLLIGSPYDLLYLYELEAKMAYWNRDTESYNRAAAMYNQLYQTYEREFHRKHHPVGKRRFFF